MNSRDVEGRSIWEEVPQLRDVSDLSRRQLAEIHAREELFDEAAEDGLMRGAIKSVEPMRSSHSRSYLVRFEDGSAGVFKPANLEQTSIGYPHNKAGTYFKRERASYLVDKYLNLGFVPPTVIRTIDGRIGSLQQFIPDTDWYPTDDEAEWMSPQEEKKFKRHDATTAQRTRKQRIEEFKRLWLFDMLIWNCDRSLGNKVVKERWLVAVDNNITFGNDPLKVYRGDHFVDMPLPEDTVETIQSLAEDVEAQEQLRADLSELLTSDEVDAFFSRLHSLAKVLVDNNGVITKDKIERYGYEGFADDDTSRGGRESDRGAAL